MTFDREAANRVVDRDDRDIAPFFAGRSEEIDAFARTLRAASRQEKPQALFRIFQGPPGCGKTSLAAKLGEVHAQDALFLPVGDSHMADEAALGACLADVSVAEGGIAARAGSLIADAIARRFGAPAAGESARRAVAEHARGWKSFVLHMDEAHARVEQAAQTLRTVHVNGIGVPCVVLLTGLAHTKRTLNGIPGLSRTADNAVSDMGALSEEECIESTMRMLEAVGVGDGRACRDLAWLAAKESFGWPQHLNIAQKAICRELLRRDGVAADASRFAIEADVAEGREAYYRNRTDYAPLALDRAVTMRSLARVQEEKPVGNVALDVLVEGEMDSSRKLFGDEGISARDVRHVLHDKGILATDVDDRITVAIPSMAAWAKVRADRERSAVRAGGAPDH